MQSNLHASSGHKYASSRDLKALPLHWVWNERALALHHCEVNTHGWQDSEDVAEHDDTIWAKGSEWLQGQLNGNVCCLRSFPEWLSI